MTFREEMAMWEVALSEAPGDWRLHLVFADWSEENGLPERADFHRRLAMLRLAEQRQQALEGCKRHVCRVYNLMVVGTVENPPLGIRRWYDGWDPYVGQVPRAIENEKALTMGATLASSAPMRV